MAEEKTLYCDSKGETGRQMTEGGNVKFRVSIPYTTGAWTVGQNVLSEPVMPECLLTTSSRPTMNQLLTFPTFPLHLVHGSEFTCLLGSAFRVLSSCYKYDPLAHPPLFLPLKGSHRDLSCFC